MVLALNRILIALGLWTLSTIAPASAQSTLVLTPNGLEPVQIGMTIEAAQKKLKAKLGRISTMEDGFSKERESTRPCWLWRRLDGIDPGINYMTEKHVIIRIDIFTPNSRVVPAVKTRAGIGIGSPETELKKKYGDGLVMDLQPSNPGVTWGIAERAGQNGLRVEVLDGKVSGMLAARSPALDYPEACS
jgi:hypothetical protein